MKFIVVGLVWLLVAVAVGASGVLAQLRPPGPQVVLVTLTVALLVASRVSGGFRDWLKSLDARWLIALHVIRFVGFYFLFLSARGQLPADFATPAGWGDIIVATGACLLLLGWSRFGRPPAVMAWNVFGLIDILFVVGSAAKHTVVDPLSMSALLRMPLNLLLTFLVPLIIASHIFIFARFQARREGRRLVRPELWP